MSTESLKLPAHFELEPELLEQLSSYSGTQRCIDGSGELLLIVHEVPKPRVPEREPLFFWKRSDDSWQQSSGYGLTELSELLDRYAEVIDNHEAGMDQACKASELFKVLSHAGPLSRSMRNMVVAFEHVLTIDLDDRAIMALRDRARELERAAELLHSDGRMALDFLRAERAEENARSGAKLNQIAFRLNLLAGFFLPLVALAGLFGMNVDLPAFVKPLFWVILIGGLMVGGVLLYLVGRENGRGSVAADDE